MKRILVADDHVIVRKGLISLISDIPNMAVTGEAGDGPEIITCLQKSNFDLVVLDIGMPGMNGIEVLKHLKKNKNLTPVLVLSVYPEDQYAIRALKAGAAGYLTKKSAPEELVTAINRVLDGRKYVSPTLSEKLAIYVEYDRKGLLHENLSDREFQIMCMLGAGKRVVEIARQLFLSVKTISTHRRNILIKMNMKSNAELIHYAIYNNLIE